MERSRTAGARALARSLAPRAGTVLLRAGSRTKRFIMKRLVTGEPTASSDPPLEQVGEKYPVIAYFAETPVRAYQLLQWLPVLDRVRAERPVAIAARSWTMTVRLRELTSIPVVYCRTLDSLMAFYNRVDAKVVIYPNNGVRNFQSLIYRRGLHVHVNHGESDKISMVSNQAKAYDVVVIAGQAARERHERALINFDLDTLVTCGRPQLDLEIPDALPRGPGRTVLYAPTWWGEDEANNYTSLDLYGLEIVRTLLSMDDVRLVYRPHPRVPEAPPGPIADVHREILRAIEAANTERGAAVHLHMPDVDILGLFEGTDLLVTDVSSVGLDFLYRRGDAPVILTDRRSDPDQLRRDAPIATATDVVDASSVSRVGDMVALNLDEDPHRALRAEMRDFYFGFERGDSTRRFLELVANLIDRRDALVGQLDPADTGVEVGDARGEAEVGRGDGGAG